jgi:integrase
MRFATFLANNHLTWQTIKTYLSGVRHYLLAFDLESPFSDQHLPRLQLLLKGIKRYSSKTTSPRQRLPITPEILQAILQILQKQPSDHDNIMIWAAMNLCFFGFLRSGEICCPSTTAHDPTWHLCIADIAIDSKRDTTTLLAKIKGSKTDPFRMGVTIAVGKTSEAVCPIKAMLPYLALRGGQPGPLFKFASGEFLTRHLFVQQVRRLLQSAGFQPASYAGHSFRIGAATTAAKKGIPDNIIQTLGRWKSSAYQSYIRLPRESLCSVSAALTKEDSPKSSASRA